LFNHYQFILPLSEFHGTHSAGVSLTAKRRDPWPTFATHPLEWHRLPMHAQNQTDIGEPARPEAAIAVG
jgi:hypothetical protein